MEGQLTDMMEVLRAKLSKGIGTSGMVCFESLIDANGPRSKS